MVNFCFYNSFFKKPRHVPYFLVVEIEVQKLLNDQIKLHNLFIAHPNHLNYINKQNKIVNLVLVHKSITNSPLIHQNLDSYIEAPLSLCNFCIFL